MENVGSIWKKPKNFDFYLESPLHIQLSALFVLM